MKSRPPFIDIGVNLTHDQLLDNIDKVINDMIDANVSNAIITSSCIDETNKALEIIDKYPNIFYTTAGFHPHNAKEAQVWYNDTTQKIKGVLTIAATWASGGNMNTGRSEGMTAGTQTAGLMSGGIVPGSDAMTNNPICVEENMLANDAMKLMQNKKINHLIVLDKRQTYIGIVHVLEFIKEGING